MPRVTSTGSSQSYMASHSGSLSTMLNGGNSNSNSSSNHAVEAAPSSATSLPRFNSMQKAPSTPAPSSMRANTSMFMNPSPSMVSPTGKLSPVRQRTVPELPTVLNDTTPRLPARHFMRAAESGKGTILPDFSSKMSPSGSSTRSRVLPSRTSSWGAGVKNPATMMKGMRLGRREGGSQESLPQTQQDIMPKTTVIQAAQQSLRRRTYSTTQSDDEDVVSRKGGYDSPYRSHGRSGRRGMWFSLQKLGRMKIGHILQVVIVIAVTALVWESHHKALYAAEQLSQFKEEESLLLLHLQKIEQQSIQLHENLSRLAQSGLKAPANEGGVKNGMDVDFELIHKQTQQLYQMESELNHEVEALQKRIQQSARNHIISEFGEGPVQVVFELDFGPNKSGQNEISILLWHDTPHAAWTWLEQIGRHVWDGAHFEWQQGHIIDALPERADPGGGKVEFVEHSTHGHEAWSVGLHESETGMMSIYINLQDNTSIHKHETCVGKVIDGFDALQRLLETARSQQDGAQSVVTIKKATATHVTKK